MTSEYLPCPLFCSYTARSSTVATTATTRTTRRARRSLPSTCCCCVSPTLHPDGGGVLAIRAKKTSALHFSSWPHSQVINIPKPPEHAHHHNDSHLQVVLPRSHRHTASRRERERGGWGWVPFLFLFFVFGGISTKNSFLRSPGPLCVCVCVCVTYNTDVSSPRSIDTSPRQCRSFPLPLSWRLTATHSSCRYLRGFRRGWRYAVQPKHHRRNLGCCCCCCRLLASRSYGRQKSRYPHTNFFLLS